MGRVKVKEVYEKRDVVETGCEPILVRFQHADGKSFNESRDVSEYFKSTVFKGSKKSETPYRNNGLLQSKTDTTLGHGNKLVALQSPNMTYLGKNNANDSVKTFIALRRGKKLRLFEVTPVTVTPFFKGESFEQDTERDTQQKKSKQERREAQVDLIKAFGSKRKRLTFERSEKHQIDVSEMNESMTKASSQIKAPEEEPIIKDESILSLIPPCNRDATSASGVYVLDDILTPEEMADMEEIALLYLNISREEIKEWESSKKYSDYFFSMWHKLTSRRSDSQTIKTAKLVIYTELLICLLKLRHDQIRKKNLELPEVFPVWLKEKAVESFTVVNAKGQRNRPDTYKDKTCCYIMVLILLANEFALDMQLLSASLNVHIKKLLTLAKAVGVTMNYNSTTKEYRGILRLPLPKPIETRGKRKLLSKR